MLFLGLTAALEDPIRVPLVSPIISALKTAEMTLCFAVTHSRMSWPTPLPKAMLERD
jgi:hypothetical protein